MDAEGQTDSFLIHTVVRGDIKSLIRGTELLRLLDNDTWSVMDEILFFCLSHKNHPFTFFMELSKIRSFII